MKLSIKKTGKLLGKDPAAKLTKAIKTELIDALEEQKKAIIERTRSGKDIRGQYFKGYTPGYAKKRAKMSLQTHPVNLTVTGDLLDTIETKIEQLGNGNFKLNLEIADEQKDKARGLQKKREFFGNSKAQEKALIERLSNLDIKATLK